MKLAILNSFKGYKASSLLKDLMSGVLVAIISLPLAIALGIQSGATLQQGIITAIVAGFIISALGGCKVQIGGPTGAFVSITLGYVASIGMLGLHVATIMAGVIMILLGLFHIGGLIKFIPFPIVVGFTTGIGVNLLVGQFSDFSGITLTDSFNLFGDSPQLFHSEFINKIGNLGSNFLSISLPTLAIGIATVLIMMVLPKISKKIPAAFAALIVTTCITLILGIYSETNFGVATIGSIYPDIKPEIILPDWQGFSNLSFSKLLMPAVVIAFLGSIESLLSATVADNMTGDSHDSNAELFGQGIANISSGFCGGLPATGAIARTSANVQNGGTTPVAGMVHSLMLLLMFFVLMPALTFVPMASLGAVLIMIALHMSNFKLYGKLATFNKRDTTILVVTLFLTLYKDLVYGVIGGMIITFIIMSKDIFIKHDLDIIEGVKVSDLHRNTYLNTIITPSSNLTFMTGTKLIENLVKSASNCDCVILDLSKVKTIDVSSAEKIIKLEKKFANTTYNLQIINNNENATKQLEKMRKI